jgi:hypothetical protein
MPSTPQKRLKTPLLRITAGPRITHYVKSSELPPGIQLIIIFRGASEVMICLSRPLRGDGMLMEVPTVLAFRQNYMMDGKIGINGTNLIMN